VQKTPEGVFCLLEMPPVHPVDAPRRSGTGNLSPSGIGSWTWRSGYGSYREKTDCEIPIFRLIRQR